MCGSLLPLGLLLAGVLVSSEGTARSDSALIEIVVPPSSDVRDLMKKCQKRTVQVEFDSWKIKGIEYKRQTLSNDDMACMSTEAVMLSVTGLAECAKAAAANDFNSFYVDAQGQCYASNLHVRDDGGSCSQEGTVVYFSTVMVSEFTIPPPSITAITIDDPVVGTSFTINFEVKCSLLYTFRVSHGDEDLGNVSPGEVVPFDVPACSDVSLTLTPYLEGVPGGSISALYSPAKVPTVEGFNVTDVEVDSITVHFTPICEGYEYKLFIDDLDLGIIQSPKTVTSQEAPDIQPCAELEVRLEAVLQEGEDPYEVSETIVTPRGPGVKDFGVFRIVNGFNINFVYRCEGFTYKLFVGNTDLGVVGTAITLTSQMLKNIANPCTELEIRLEAQLPDGADPYAISSTLVTPLGTEFYNLSVTQLDDDDSKFTVNFEPACYFVSYSVRIDDEDPIIIAEEEGMFTIQHPDMAVDPCTDMVFSVFATGELAYEFGESSQEFTLRTRGACARHIETIVKGFDVAAASCPDGKSLIDSKDLLGSDKTFALTQNFWVSLRRRGDVWQWGDSEQTEMPTTDPLWARPPSTTGNSVCAVYNPLAHTLSAVVCSSYATTVCV